MTLIHGVDTAKTVSAYDVRDAIVERFIIAHDDVLNDLKNYGNEISDTEFADIKQIDVKQLIKTYFNEVGGDYEHPTKEAILKVIDKLRAFSLNFRSTELINRHTGEMMKLVNCLK